MKDTVIRFENVSKIYKLYSSTRKRLIGIFIKKIPYKKKNAVDNMSFEIERGESVALFGKNGAGNYTYKWQYVKKEWCWTFRWFICWWQG